MPLTDEQAAEIRAALKRCRPETIDAALRFRVSGDAIEVPAIVYGIVERHLAPEVSQKMDLHRVEESTRLVEDLGIDSLTTIEFMFKLEDEFSISLSEERGTLNTVRDIANLVDAVRHRKTGPT